MERTFAAGAGLTGLGVAGYLLGVQVGYPGRAFSVTAVMIGITLLSVAERDGGGAA